MWKPELAPMSGRGKTKALFEAIAKAVRTGELSEGEKLPPQRDLAHALGLSFQTVSNAYRKAQGAKLVTSEVGRGTYVSSQPPNRPGSFILNPGPSDQIDLSVTYLSHLPILDDLFRDTVEALGQEPGNPWMYQSRPVAGAQRHRLTAAAWLRGMNVEAGAEQLFIVNGATQGIFLALAAVTNPGNTVLTETLTENGTIGAASLLGLNLQGVNTDEKGIIPEALDEACRRFQDVAALVWVPSLGNPKAHMADEKRREDIARVADRHDIALIEDEVYRPLVDRGLPAAPTLYPRKGFFTTSLTKSVMTGLRVGYLVAPPPYTFRIATAMRSTTWSCPPLLSEIADRWLADGTVEMLNDLRRKEAVARHALVTDYLAPYIQGSHMYAPYAWLRLPEGWTETTISNELQEANLLVSTSAPFAVATGTEPGVRISVSCLEDRKHLRRALHILKDTFEKLPMP